MLLVNKYKQFEDNAIARFKLKCEKLGKVGGEKNKNTATVSITVLTESTS